jgi:hypothetical protein
MTNTYGSGNVIEHKGTSGEIVKLNLVGAGRVDSNKMFWATYDYITWQGVADIWLQHNEIHQNSLVFASITEYSPDTGQNFMGAGGLAIYNVTPVEGFVIIKRNSTWGSEIHYKFMILIVNP